MSPTMRRLVRSYGLLIVLAIGFLALVMFVREKPEVVPANVIVNVLR